MKKIRAFVSYPWAGVRDDEYDFEVEDDATEEEIDELAKEYIEELIWNRVSSGWEEI